MNDNSMTLSEGPAPGGRRKGPDHERQAALLGKRVRVVLGQDRDGPVIAEGILLGFGDDGTVELEQDDCFVHYCWPMLEVEEAPSPRHVPARPRRRRDRWRFYRDPADQWIGRFRGKDGAVYWCPLPTLVCKHLPRISAPGNDVTVTPPFEPDWTVPPGATLAEFMREHELTSAGLAGRIGCPAAQVEDVLGDRGPITTEMADGLEAASAAPSAQFWRNLEANYQADLIRLGRERGQ